MNICIFVFTENICNTDAYEQDNCLFLKQRLSNVCDTLHNIYKNVYYTEHRCIIYQPNKTLSDYIRK